MFDSYLELGQAKLDEFDVDGNGTFDAFELKEALASSGYSLNTASLGKIVRLFAIEDDQISIDGFIRCLAQLQKITSKWHGP